jgi:hypothetical protein
VGHYLAVTSDGTVWALGWNANDQFGNGTRIGSAGLPVVPVLVAVCGRDWAGGKSVRGMATRWQGLVVQAVMVRQRTGMMAGRGPGRASGGVRR